MKTCLVLEGGGMRGMFTCGVLDVLMENNINVDVIVGVSAGALYGPNYFSNQPHRALRYTKKYCADKRYMGMKSLLLTGNIVNKQFAFYDVTEKLDPFDNKLFMKTNKDFYAVATNVNTGKPEYFKIEDVIKDMEKLRATSALPFVSRMVEIEGKKYLDGGISDSIPVEFARTLGCDKVIVVLTQPKEYRKEKTTDKQKYIFKLRYGKHKKLAKLLMNRNENYNKQVDRVNELEKNKDIYVIRPPKPLNISRLEKDKNKVQEIYDIGYKEANNKLKELEKYIKKSIK